MIVRGVMAGPGSKSKRHYKENLSKSFQEKKFLFRNVKFELMRGRGVMAGPGSCNSPRQTGSDVCRPGLAHRPILSKTKTKTVTKTKTKTDFVQTYSWPIFPNLGIKEGLFC